MIGLLDPEDEGITKITTALSLPSLLECYAMLSHKYFLMVRRITVPSSSGPGSSITLLGLLDLEHQKRYELVWRTIP
jgi:hypothetical protein